MVILILIAVILAKSMGIRIYTMYSAQYTHTGYKERELGNDETAR